VKPSERAATAAAPSKTESAPISLSGTIVAIDEFGTEHRHENGLLTFDFDAGDSRTHREVEVQRGTFTARSVPLNGGEAVSVRTCLLGNRVAVAEQAAALKVPADGRIELRVRWLAGLLLHVRGRDTGLELENVFLYELPLADRGSPADALHPGSEAKAKERAVGPSPVRFDVNESAWLGPRVFYARSPGYAWGRIELDPRENVEPTLLLDPAESSSSSSSTRI
jgi:hypothetical protein